ncbi:hypothetical protein K3495_g13189 [Podosphaera aphanis]|nr:hypothetical protein K3495_g13189 [Podosphaera aphanis]
MSRLRPFQVASDLSRDLLQLVITHRNMEKLPIWNIYNSPTGSDDAGRGLSYLFGCSGSPFYVGGDFNLRHPLWDSSVSYAQRTCTDLINWYENKGLKLLNPTETPTHNRGGTLDLVFCSDNSAKCEVRPDLNTSSDHETLLTSLRWSALPHGATKLRYSALDNDLFLRLLNSHHDSVPISAQEDLETEACNIVEIIRTALLGACPRKGRRKYGTPWWSDECRYAAHSYRRARREGNAN